MANQWLRLWHEMPNDPKWRTISRSSKQNITVVLSVWVHVLVTASNATERGVTIGWNDEDVASALDIDVGQVIAVKEAMQGRVLDGDRVTGWEKRQPSREDNSTERTKTWRDKRKLPVTNGDVSERSVTQSDAPEPDKEKINIHKLASKETHAEEVLPSHWHDVAEKRGVPDEQIYKSWRKFKEITSFPYEFEKWKAWIAKEKFKGQQLDAAE